MNRLKNYVLAILFGEDGVSVGAWDIETDSDAEAENTFNAWTDNARKHVDKMSCTISWYVYGEDEDGYLEETRKQFAVIK